MYQAYIEIQKQIDLLEEKKDLLRKEIKLALPEEGYKDDFIKIFWTVKNKYEYSPKVKGLQVELETTMKKEEEEGIADKKEVRQLTIKIK